MRKNWLTIFLWTIVILVNVYFIYNFPFKHFNLKSWNRPFGPLLTFHIIFGLVALLVGPIQFFPSVRRTQPRFHRVSGRIYLVSLLLAAACAILLSINHNIIVQKRYIFGTGLLGLAGAWLLTSGMAFWAIKKRNYAQHREWMIKSYVVTCGFTTYRIFAVTLNNYLHLDYNKEMSGIMAWACWAVPLLITEAFLQAGKIRNTGFATNRAANRVSI